MPTFAAIDVGSNACRLLIATVDDPRNIKLVRNERRPTRLGHEVFQTRTLAADSIDATVKALHEFSTIMRNEGVDHYRAVATASVRSAKNGEDLLSRIEKEARLDLSIIDGIEEARLIALALKHKVDPKGETLLMDLGGGSLEFILLRDSEPQKAISLEIGTVRILESFLKPERAVTKTQDRLVRSYLRRMLKKHEPMLRQQKWNQIYGTGGNFVATAKLCVDSPKDEIVLSQIPILLGELAAMTPQERSESFGFNADRADVIVPALYVLDELRSRLDTNTITTPKVGLKDGILRQLIEKHFGLWDYAEHDEHVGAEAIKLGRKYNFDEEHALQTARLATQLFDTTAVVHHLGSKERLLLRLAALLHDVGEFVNPSAHHKHAAYIIRNSSILGLSPRDRALVAMLARYHRRAAPSDRHCDFRELSDRNRSRILFLAPLLRLADGLDRGHRGRVRGIRADMYGEFLRIDVDSAEDASLEVWTARHKSAFFEKIYEIPVKIEGKIVSAAPPSTI